MNPEDKIREVVDLFADCDICRYLMETTCHMLVISAMTYRYQPSELM